MNRGTKLLRIVGLVQNWPTYLLDYYGLIRRRPVVYRLRNGLRFNLEAHTFDSKVLAEVWIHRIYMPRGDEIRAGDTVVDVGAHAGVFTTQAARCAAGGRVVAFEPTPDNFGRLMANVAANRLDNVTAVQKAIAGKTERRDFFLGENDTVAHSLTKGWGGDKALSVECLTLRDAMSEYGLRTIQFLKLDCEGAELEILFGCDNDTLRAVGRMSIEVHETGGSDHTGEIKRLLEGKGFDVQIDQYSIHAVNRSAPVPLPG